MGWKLHHGGYQDENHGYHYKLVDKILASSDWRDMKGSIEAGGLLYQILRIDQE